jgi:PAS domain S-box-containing protein
LAALAAALIRSRRENAALRITESRFSFAARVSEIGLFDHDHHTGEIYRSPELCRLYAMNADGRGTVGDFLERVHPDDRDAVSQAVVRAHDPQSEGLFDVQHRLVRSDGEVRWLSLRSLTLFEGEGASRHAVRTVGTAADITSLKRIDEALRQSGERLRQVIRVSRIGIYDHDHITDQIYWSAEQRQNYGFSADEPIVLEKFLDCVHPDDRAAIAVAVARAHDPSGNGLFDVEHRIIRRDGQVRWLITRSRTFFSDEGTGSRPIHTIGAVLDVTDRRRADEALWQREQIYSAVVSQSADGIGLVDTETLRFVEFNDAACVMLRFTREAFGLVSLPELAPDAVAAERIRSRVAATPQDSVDLGLTDLKRRDGALLPVWLTSRRVFHHDRIYLAVVWRDMTERDKVDRSNRQLATLVRHSNEFIGIADMRGNVEFVNEFGRRMAGIGPDDSLDGLTIPSFIHPSEHERLSLEIVPAIVAHGYWSGQLAFRRQSDGTAIPTLTEGFRIDDINGQPLNIATTSRDITELEQADAELRRLNSVYLTLSHTNQAIVRAGTEAELLTRICEIATEDGGFALAFISLFDAGGMLRAEAACGPARGYFDGLRVTADERFPEGRGPVGLALRSGSRFTVSDIESSEIMAPWGDRARRFGLKSSSAFPLFRAGRVIGILSVYSTVVDHFGEREISLLDDMAADISFGLESLQRARELDRSVKLIRDIEATVRVGALRLILPDWSLWWSEGTAAVLGLPAATAADRAALESAFDPEIARILIVALEEAAQTGNPIDIDLPLRDQTAGEAWIRLFGIPRRGDGGTTEISCTLQDISERKNLESQVSRAADAERRRLASELHDNLGQILFGLSLLLTSIVKQAHTTGSPLADKIEQTTAILDQAMQVCRTLAHGISPLLEGGLSAALSALAEEIEATGVECVVAASNSASAMVTGARALEIFRIVQEAISNALKHGRCRRIEVGLAVRGSSLEVSIRDDGAGVDLSASGLGPGIGLQTMRYRAARAGGTMEMRSNPGHGTTVKVRVPLLAEDSARTVANSGP